MTIIDIGANLANPAFAADLAAVLLRAHLAGLKAVVITGTSLAGSREAANIASAMEIPAMALYSTAGVHPHGARHWTAGDAAAIERLVAESGRVVAIGECGLDYNRDFSPRAAQLAAFEAQIDLAGRLGLPLFLHERDAHRDFLAILRKKRALFSKAVVHCFTGHREELESYLELDLHIGITGWICDERRGRHLADLVRLIPANRLMIETDAPYLTPKSLRPAPKGGRNEPAFLPLILEKLASCRGETAKQLAESTNLTTQDFFGIP